MIYFKNLYATKLENLKEIDEIIDNLLKSNKDEISHLSDS